MKLDDMRKNNALKIYNEIAKHEYVNIYDISAECDLSIQSVLKIAKELEKRKFVKIVNQLNGCQGRPRVYLSPSNVYYSVYIHLYEDTFSTIAISTSGGVILRMDYPVNYRQQSIDESLADLVSEITSIESFPYCMGMYLINKSSHLPNIPKSVISLSAEKLIASSLASDDEIILFHTDDIIILSLYSRLQFPSCSKEEILKVIEVDSIIKMDCDSFDEIFKAMSKKTEKDLQRII